MTHNMKIKYPFYISENPFIYSLFHTVGFVSHSVKYVSHSVKYVSHTVVFVFHTVKQRICQEILLFIQEYREKLVPSFHRYRLSQIAWLVDIHSTTYCNVISQQLQRNGSD